MSPTCERILVQHIPAAEKARSASTDIGGIEQLTANKSTQATHTAALENSAILLLWQQA